LDHPVSGERFGREVMIFLGRMRENARPDSKIVVIGRDWSNIKVNGYKSELKSLIPMTTETLITRKKLYDILKAAVTEVATEGKSTSHPYSKILIPSPKSSMMMLNFHTSVLKKILWRNKLLSNCCLIKTFKESQAQYL